VAVEFHKENLDFTGDDSPSSKLMLTIMGAMAEFERAMIRERQREGIAAAKAKGMHLGRVAKLTKAKAKELRKRIAAGEYRAEVAEAFGICNEICLADRAAMMPCQLSARVLYC
jgi:DNA invertase Pin-like site-specific DNA recombinase